MAKNRTRTKKSKTKKSKSSRGVKDSSNKYHEKLIITAMISVIVIGFVVWISQDFPAQGQAYQISLNQQAQSDISLTVLSSCKTNDGCAYVNSVAESSEFSSPKLNGKSVDAYELTFYDSRGNEITGTTSGNLIEDNVVTIGYQGTRYPSTQLNFNP